MSGPRTRATAIVAAAALLAGAGPRDARGADVEPLEDNSFLIEEAYNQGPRVVQHIGHWARTEPAGDYVFTFAQEWPLIGQRHQLAYAIPFQSLSAGGQRGVGFGDVEIQYRYQWLGMGDSRLAAAPSLTLLFPTGDESEELGSGAVGGEIGLPLSAVLSSRFVTHTNLKATYTGEASGHPAKVEYELGQSLVWLAASRFNPMVEVVWSRSEPAGGGTGESEEVFVLNPGFRWAHDFPSGLQICPGISFPIGVGATSGDSGVLIYLSFEHGF